MERPSIFVIIVVLLLCVLFLREPRFQRSEEIFLRWVLRHSEPTVKGVPLTVVDVGKENPPAPLEAALLVQGLLEFKPTVVAIEPTLQWGEGTKDQEQIFMDQAMRVPRLLLGAKLTASVDPDAPVTEIPGFTNVSGRRGDLPEFSGIELQPDEDVRILSTVGFTNFPSQTAANLTVPLLFQYRGEVIPTFTLQALMLWLRVTPEEVKIDIGSSIQLPNGVNIPIRSDGTLLVNPRMALRSRQITIDELFLAAQQHEDRGTTGTHLEDIPTQLVLSHTTSTEPDLIAAAIATIQSKMYVHRISPIFDCVMVVLVAALSGWLRRFSRVDLIIGTIAFSAAYVLIAVGTVSAWAIWLPGFLPLGAVWISVLRAIILPKPRDSARNVAATAPTAAPQ
ncbi:MAG TPA: hypothetical protein VEH26_01925 [Chthoniobacterales bacterium]|nr:hypothetical protein [Chthoniobacterales bacterium]